MVSIGPTQKITRKRCRQGQCSSDLLFLDPPHDGAPPAKLEIRCLATRGLAWISQFRSTSSYSAPDGAVSMIYGRTAWNSATRPPLSAQHVQRLANTIPATPAGAAALIQHALDEDLSTDERWWHMTALRSAVAALNSMGA